MDDLVDPICIQVRLAIMLLAVNTWRCDCLLQFTNRQGTISEFDQGVVTFNGFNQRDQPIGGLVVRGYGVMFVRDSPVAVDLAQAHGQPK